VDAWMLDDAPLRKDLEEGKITRQDWLRFMVPVQYGIQIALEVLDPASETFKRLQPLEAELAVQNQKERDILLSEGVTRGLGILTYNRLIEGIEEQEPQKEEPASSNSE